MQVAFFQLLGIFALSALLSGWQTEHLRAADESPVPRPPVTALAITPDRSLVVVGSQEGLELRTFPDLSVTGTLPTKLTNIHDLTFSPDGKLLVVAGGDPGATGSIELMDWPTKSLLHEQHPSEDLVYSVVWRSDSKGFATGSDDQRVRLHQVDEVNAIQSLQGHSRSVLALAFSPGDVLLLSAGADESIRIWDWQKSTLVRTLAHHTAPVTGLAVCPTSREADSFLLASISEDRTVRLWQPTIGRMVRFVRLESPANALGWSADGTQIFTACKDGHVRVIDRETMTLLRDVAAIHGVSYSLAVASDGSVLIGGQAGQVCRVK